MASPRQRFSLILLFTLLIFMLLPSTFAKASIVNPKQVYSYQQMERDIKKLADTYPDLIEYHIIGESEFGRPIYAVSLGNGLSTSYINGSNHAREWITTNLTMYMIDQYAKAYSERRSIGGYDVRSWLDKHQMWFVPMINPDGVMLQQQGLPSVPSGEHASVVFMNNNSFNLKRWKANGKGIDLNRQFNANWANLANSPGRPSFANYKGKAPHTAKEVKAVLELTEKIKPEMAVSYHSSGQILFWNFHQQGAQLTRDRSHARAIGQMTGYSLMGRPSSTGGGGYTDWFIQEYKKPAFTPELGTFVGATNVPLSQFDRIWNQNRLVGLYIARESHKMFESRLLNTYAPVSIEINGERMPQAGGSFSVQGRTVVPLRSIFEKLGASVKWDAANREVGIASAGTNVRLPVHRPYAYVNDEKTALDVPALLVDNRTYVPVRFIVEALGAQVEWVASERTVKITYVPKTVQVQAMAEESQPIEQENGPARQPINEILVENRVEKEGLSSNQGEPLDVEEEKSLDARLEIDIVEENDSPSDHLETDSEGEAFEENHAEIE